MSLFTRIFHRDDVRKSVTVEEIAGAADVSAPAVPEPEDMEELIAVLTAAVAACMGRPADGIVVRNVLRVPETAPVWARAGLTDQMNARRSF